jgi:Na+/proline symporter
MGMQPVLAAPVRTYRYGVSGPFWYASGATIQVLLFAVLAVEIKRKAPTIHTVLEIVKARWGTAAHITFLVFCLLTNIVVTSMLILGGAKVVEALTGAACLGICVGSRVIDGMCQMHALLLGELALQGPATVMHGQLCNCCS